MMHINIMYMLDIMYMMYVLYRRLGGESNREIVSFRCVRAGEAKLRERVRASVSLLAGLANRIGLAVSRLSAEVFYFSVRSKWF